MRKLKTQKGITLVALIITIVVLLILAGVTIGAVKDSDIIGYAKKAATEFNKKQKEEEEKLNGYLTELNGTEGTILEKYVLGTSLTGRNIEEILNISSEKCINDESTIKDAETEVVIYLDQMFQENNLTVGSIKYKDVIYRFGIDNTTGNTDANYGVQEVFNPSKETRIGKTVEYDGKLWTIIYDNDKEGLQMISNTVVGERFRLGFEDSSIENWDTLLSKIDINNDGNLNQLEKCIYSYNNAINTLNTACYERVTNSSNIKDVRCVGSNPQNKNAENTELYTSENLEIWPEDVESLKGKVNGLCKSEDDNYIYDYIRMKELNIIDMSEVYWLSSRYSITDSETDVWFYIRECFDSSLGGYGIVGVGKNYTEYAPVMGLYLRPVVTLNSDVQFSGEGTTESPYVFN